MDYIARERGEDPEPWAVIGLVHDLDWEKFPERHCYKTEEIHVNASGWPPDYVRAVLSHGWQICTDVEPRSELEKNLYAAACERTGCITGCALPAPAEERLADSRGATPGPTTGCYWKSASFAHQGRP